MNFPAYWISDDFLCFKGVDGDHRDIANQQECDDLAAGLGAIMFWQMNSSTSDISDEQKLQNDLQDGN